MTAIDPDQGTARAPGATDGAASEAPTATVTAVDHRGGVGVWAFLGAVFLVLAGQAFIRWIFSAHLAAATVLGPDKMPHGKLVTLRVLEVLSVLVAVALIYLWLVRPVRRGTFSWSLQYLLAIGCVVSYWTEGILDIHQYLFAWNAHSINLGVWTSFLPTYNKHTSTDYAEALLWGAPMYLYQLLGIGLIGGFMVMWMRRRNPDASNGRTLSVVFVVAFIWNTVLEQLIMRATDAYAFVRAPKVLTLFPNTLYQFPLSESLLVGLIAVSFTKLWLSAKDAPDGVSFIERGADRFRPSLRTPVRGLAAIGFVSVVMVMVYHIPTQFFLTDGNAVAPLPSYMEPGPR